MGKSGAHKAENTFRFQTFSERVKNINIDVIHQIRHHDDTPEETGTYFQQGLEKQTELNCTEHFSNFKREVSVQVQTFAQLVHYEENIVAALKKHLLVPRSMAIPALLDLLVQLARDLQRDFYRHFEEFFHVLVELLTSYHHDVEVLEATFSALSHLVKFLWRYLLKDVQPVFGFFSDLLSRKNKEYVRNFAAESFAFLMRKSRDHSALFDFMFKSLEKDPDKSQGVGRLMFEMMKGVKGQFHSCAAKAFPLLLEKLGPTENQSSDMLPWQQVEESLATTVLSMAFHADKEHLADGWTMILAAISKIHKRWEGRKQTTVGTEISDTLGRLLRLTKILVEFKHGKMINSPDQVAKVLLEMLRGASFPDVIGQELLSVTAALLNKAHSRLQVEVSAKLVPAVFKTSYPAAMLFNFTRELFNLPLFEKDVLPSLLKYCASTSSTDLARGGQETLAILTDLVLFKCPQPGTGETLDGMDTYMLDFGAGCVKKGFPAFLSSILDQGDSILTEADNHATLWSALICLPHVRPLADKDRILEKLSDLLKEILQQTTLNDSLAFIGCQAVVTMAKMFEEKVFQQVPVETITKSLCSSPGNVHLLRLVDMYLSHAVSCGVDIMTSLDTLMTIFPALQPNLSSPYSLVRLLSLRILSNFELPLPESEVEHVSVFRICLRAESTEPGIQTYRERLRHLQMLEFSAVQPSIPAGPFAQVPLRYLIGSLFVNFKLLWEPIRTLINSHAQNMDREAFWEVMGGHLEMASENAEKLILEPADQVTVLSSSSPELAASPVHTTFRASFDSMGVDPKASPDFTHFRLQLWKSMHQFPEKCSPKSRLFVPLLFRFLKNEYYLADLSIAPTQDVRKKSADDTEMQVDDNAENSDSIVLSLDSTKSLEVTSPGSKPSRRKRKNIDKSDDDDSDDEVDSNQDTKKPTTRKSARLSRSLKGDRKSALRSSDSNASSDQVAMETGNMSPVRRITTRSQTLANEKENNDEDDDDDIDDDDENDDDDDEGMLSSKTQRVGTREGIRKSSRISGNRDVMEIDNEADDSENEESSDSENEDEEEINPKKYIKGESKTPKGETKQQSSKNALKENTGNKSVSEITDETNAKSAFKGKKEGVVKKAGNKKRHAATSSLLVHLELFAKFKDPKCMYMEGDLRKLYFELLIHKNANVQRTAFQCIMTYKFKYLVPYRENFERLLDEKTFKTEIVLFSIDNENTTISAEHRPDVLPVLMRILFGKMHAKTGKNTSGKQHTGVRQSIVFRFLNGCQQDELKMFIDLVFAPFQQLVSENPLKMVKAIKQESDLSSVLPVKKMQGALNSIDMVFKKLGHHLEMFLSSVLQIVVGMATLCGVLLSNRDRLVPHVLTPLKSIRQNTVYRIIQIFSEYDKYPWRPLEIDAIFEAAVWPQLDRLADESLTHPTPLLKLLLCWTQNPRYFSLLAKHHKDNTELSPLPHVIKLLLHKDCSGHVTSVIMEMVDNLLEDPEESPEIRVIEVNDMVKLSSAEEVKDAGLGVKLLVPHIPDLLTHIQKFVVRLGSVLRGKKHKAKGKELNILSRLSTFVRDEEMSMRLISLLLPFLGKRFSRNLTTEGEILTSVLHLLRRIPDRSSFFNTISRLFATLEDRGSRMALADVFAVVCEGHEDLETLGSIVQQLNSYDTTRVEEPDYMLRLQGYRTATSLVEDMVTMDTRICLTLIHNCCFFIQKVEDMSLRDNSSMLVMAIVKHCGKLGFHEKTYNTLILAGLMPELRSALKTKKQVVFHEFVSILSVLVDTFGNQSMFEDLKPLRDTDLDADFFENLKHIQVYKRSRGLRRLIKHLDTKPVKRDTIASIFLPMVSTFLADEAYKKHVPVQDAAVEAIGVICQLLPWKQYENQLKFYLKQLPLRLNRQKLLVRVIVSIMDHFHFDLSQSTLNVKKTPVPKVERAEDPDDVKPPSAVEAMATDAIKEADGTVADDTSVAADDNKEPEIPEINAAVEEKAVSEELPKGAQLCSPVLATKIHEMILKTIIPQLHHILVQKAKSDSEHKMVKSKYPEDEEILRVPIALAMVKLLQRLPKGALERFLPGILLKVCNFLKSRSPDIRNTSRETLVKIQATLGPRFFPFILSELRGSLRRGYQRHVLCYTVFMLLRNMQTSVRPGDIDICLTSLQQVFNDEVFGEVGEEKEVQGITAKVFEARKNKSYDSYELIAKFIAPGSLLKVMEPIKQVLDTTHSHKSARKAGQVLKKLATGLLDNSNITTEMLLVFVHTQTTETLPFLTDNTAVAQKKEEERPGQKPQNCLLLPTAAPRGGTKPKTSKKTNKHVLVEFGLQLLCQCLKRQNVLSTDVTHVQMLDPLVPMFAECLNSKYVMINSNCLRVLCYLFKFPLPSLKIHVRAIASSMFVLLRKYATAGAAKGDNLELVSMLFKCVTVLVRDARYYEMESSQLQVLLTFCEEDLHDYNRQSTAFTLLKAILSRQLNVPELHQLMKKVREMSISAESPHVQRECRQAMMQYILDYRHGKRLQSQLQFYVSQLTYELESGRQSALEMLAAFFTNFPQSVLSEYAGLFFLPMSASLANDESVKCRKLLALAIKSLLGKLDHNSRTNLYSYVLKWFMDVKLKLRCLAAQLCGLFVEVEGGQFESRLTDTLPVLEQQLEPGKYKQVGSEVLEREQDRMIYTMLNTLVKVVRECGQLLTDKAWEGSMNVIWENVDSYLNYPHLWVQLSSSQLFGLLFAAWQPEHLVTMATEQRTHYLAVDTRKKLRSFAFDFVRQLQSELLTDELANQVVKNMIFVTRCAHHIEQHQTNEDTSNLSTATESDIVNASNNDGDDGNDDVNDNSNCENMSDDDGDDDDDDGDDDGDDDNTKDDDDDEAVQKDTDASKGHQFSVLWLVRKMAREAHYEAINHSKVTIKRMHVFKWLAAVSLDLGPSMDTDVLRAMIPPLQREMNDQSSTQDAGVRNLAGEVVDLLKKTVGMDHFTTVYASTQKLRAERKDKRKQLKAVQAVANPEIAAKRKLKKNLAKIAAKKRKLETLKGTSRKAKKRKFQELTKTVD